MLKKAISFSIIILLLFLAYQYGINFLKKNHTISYSIEKEESFKIEENYIKNSNNDYYLIKVTNNDKNEFIFDINNLFNKQKQIVEDVSVYEDNGWYCLSLIYKNKKKSSIPLCEKEGTIYSYNYAKNNINLDDFISKLPNIESDGQYKDAGNSGNGFNKGYLDDDETMIFYKYKNLSIITNKIENNVNFSSEDQYKNILGSAVGKFYIIPKYTSNATVKEYIKYDFEANTKNIISFNAEISKQSSYINGVYEGKLYIFDKSTLTQYEIDPYNDKTIVTGNKDKDAIAIINGEEKNISVYEMNEKNIVFTPNLDIYSKIKYDSIYPFDEFAIYTSNGNMNKVYNKYPDNSIVLINDSDVKEIKATNNSIYYIKDDTLYKYNKNGIFVITKSNELKYNNENIYDIFLNN